MKWSIEFSPKEPPFVLDYREEFISLGSCFSTEIATKMLDIGWSGLENPLGVLYNPRSLYRSMEWLLQTEKTTKDFFFYRGLWRNWNCHSQIATISAEKALALVKEKEAETTKLWKEATVLFLTLGSAYVWKNREIGEIVANCHQYPQKNFQRELMTIDDIYCETAKLIKMFRQNKARVKIVITVSPVRYLRDGVVESNRSKARLLEAVHQLEDDFSDIYYFPAYEIVNDQLRDYRFFAEDLVHPSKQAINFVWEQFQETLFSDKTKHFVSEGKRIHNMFRHRILSPESETAKQFIQKREEQKRAFLKKFFD